MNIEQRINDLADKTASEGMVIRASEIREAAVEIARQRHEIERLRRDINKARGLPDRPVREYRAWK